MCVLTAVLRIANISTVYAKISYLQNGSGASCLLDSVQPDKYLLRICCYVFLLIY
jgi:hypothetical protein